VVELRQGSMPVALPVGPRRRVPRRGSAWSQPGICRPWARGWLRCGA